jgi:hypothetical protein
MKIYLKTSYAILATLFIVLIGLGIYYGFSSGIFRSRVVTAEAGRAQFEAKFQGLLCATPEVTLVMANRGGEQKLYEVVCLNNSAVDFDQYLRNLKERYSDWTVFNEYRQQLILRQTVDASSSFTIKFEELRLGLNLATLKMYVLDAGVMDNRLASDYYRLLSTFNHLLLP